MDSFLGTFQWRNSKAVFTKDGSNLLLEIDNENYGLPQVGKHIFVIDEEPIKITFPENIDGKVIFWEPDGYLFKMKKILK